MARGLIRRRSANPIKSPFVCLKTGKETGKEATGGCVVVVLSVPNSVYVPTVQRRYRPAAAGVSLPGAPKTTSSKVRDVCPSLAALNGVCRSVGSALTV